MAKKNKSRSDAEYEIESAAKTLLVLESLEGTSFEPVPIETVMSRTKLSRDFCNRALRTLRIKHYAAQNENGEWSVGKRFVRFAHNVSSYNF